MAKKLKQAKDNYKWLVKGTSHDFVFQISLFSTLAYIFAYLETPPMY